MDMTDVGLFVLLFTFSMSSSITALATKDLIGAYPSLTVENVAKIPQEDINQMVMYHSFLIILTITVYLTVKFGSFGWKTMKEIWKRRVG